MSGKHSTKHVASDGKAPWIGSRAGMSDEVLAPWTPIQVETSGQTTMVRPWGRVYEFDRLPFPSRIESGGRSMLAAPIRLIVRADGREVSWEDSALEIREQTPALVRLSHKACGGPLTLVSEILIEYDGTIRIDWDLQPREKARLEEVTLEIPVRAEHASYFYHFPIAWPSKTPGAGALSPDGFVGGFRPFIWLGDEERGLAWFCESDENWRADDANLVTEISRSYDSGARVVQMILRLHPVSEPTEVAPAPGSPSLSYTFGLQATPVKPVVEDVWDYRISHVDANLSHYAAKAGLKISETDLDRLAAAGVKTLAFHEHWTDIESYVSTTHTEDLRGLVKGCHDRGMQLLLYFGFLISDLAPEWGEFGGQCVVMPRAGYEPYDEPPQPKQNAFKVCYNSAWQDCLAAGLAELIDEFDVDGVYLDGTEYPWACANRRHGCGHVRPDGGVSPTYPIWAVRSMMKRIYTIVKTRKPEGQVNVHNSTCMTIPTLGWATSYWDGEQFRDLPPGTSAAEVLPLDVFRTEFMGHQWGVPAEFLSYESQDQKTFSNEQTYAFTLLHDVLTRSYDIGPALQLASRLWRLGDEFGRKQAEWLPYWRNEEYVTVEPEGAYASLYRHPKNGVLAVISNLGREAAAVTARLNIESLGLGGDPSARDALTGEAVALDAGAFTITLAVLGWKVVWLNSKP